MSDIELLRPKTLDEFVGQEAAKERLQVWMNQAIYTVRPLPHVLLLAEPGQGKTSLARVIASELHQSITELDLAKASKTRLTETLLQFPGGILFLDEVHQATVVQQEQLLQVAEEGRFTTGYGMMWELPWVTIIAATTKPQKLDPAFRQRFPIQLELVPYTRDEIVAMMRQMADALKLRMPEQDAVGLAEASLGNPREARNLVLGYRALGADACVESVLNLLGREPDGLTAQHLRYLGALRDFGGQVGERPLSTILRVHPSILFDLESTLLDRCYIRLTRGGRVLTAKGAQRMCGRPVNGRDPLLR